VKVSNTCTAPRSTIPSPHNPNALSIADGQTHVGKVLHHDGAYFAFDADDVLVGEYRTQREAARALPRSVS
jgi:hypothetical protein